MVFLIGNSLVCRPMNAKLRSSLAALALVATLAAACGGGDDDGGEQASPTTVTTGAAATLDCQAVGFTPNSEDVASSVKATGLPCSEAEAFVRIAGLRTSSGGPARLDVEGYRCVLVRSTQEPIPQAFYECTSGSKKVTFVRS